MRASEAPLRHPHHYSYLFLLIVLAVLWATLAPVSAFADNLYASIRGSVADQTGALVADAKLTATNLGTGLSYSATSGADGAFSFLQLPIGEYKVVAEKAGFKMFTATHIHLELDEIFNLKVAMEVGGTSETIVVEANPTQVETTSMQLGTTVTSNQLVDLPLNGRNWTQLQQLQPGVVAASDRFGTLGNYSGNGSGTQQNSFLVNGNDSNEVSLQTPLVVPSPDAIGEVSFVTSTINPEYGRNSGVIINAAVKNGTNQFHGSAYEFYRDTFLDAKNWFETKASPFHQNDFGGTVGGPIVKDHAFFFFSLERVKRAFPQNDITLPGTPVVYTQAEQGGDFSAADAGKFGSNPIAFPMFGDTASPCPVSGGVMCQPGQATSTYANLFSTGVIPTQDLNPLAVKLMNQFIPLPNAAGNRFLFNSTSTGTSTQYLYRLDEKARANDAIWFYGLWQSVPQSDTLPFSGASLPGFGQSQQQHIQQYTVAWTHTFSPTTLNEARFGYTRFNFQAVNPIHPVNPTSYGFTGINPQSPPVASLPVMNVNGFFSLGFSSNGPQPRYDNTYQVFDNFSKVAGRHSLKAGFTMERLQISNPFYPNLSGTYTFGGGGPFSTGISNADFLLGLPDAYNQGSGSIIRSRGQEYYSYAQDQWQVRQRLTLTLGVGWDIETPFRNLYDNGLIQGAWRPGQQSTVFPTAPPGFVYPGDKGINKYGGINIPMKDLGPRLGFAWSPTTSGKWSIRGGIGLYYNRSEGELTLQTLQNAPFSIASIGGAAVSSPGFANPFATANAAPVGAIGCANATGTAGCRAVANPFPFTPPSPGDTNIDFAQYAPIGFNWTSYDAHFTTARITNFNLNIERQLSKSTIVTVSYVGALGRHEEGAYDTNLAGSAPGVNLLAAASGCPTGLRLHAAALCPLQTPITENPNLTWTNGPQTPGSTPFNIGVYGHPGQETSSYNSNYNALQVEFNRHLSQGLQVQAAYTWSRNFDQTSNLENSSFNFPGINPYNPAALYGPSANDAPQRLVVNFNYTLPFYKLGHHWRRVTDDWQLAGIYTLQHGFPIPVFDFFSTALICDNFVGFFACPDRADRTGAPLNITNPRNATNQYFNPAAFAVPALGAGIGNANRNPVYGPGINYMDLALHKSIHIDETRYLELRLETFDTFNHANFANPATPSFQSEDVSEPGFGQIFQMRQITTNGDGRVVQLGAKLYF
ncbi:MAG TPA: carboxypeptidase regulatory-like domain-containing protein [Terriglobales bacterium]|nr:carboxypeptidase regulatory-like domain-containing protein [Terriglobales bacterium]